ncbi:TIGR03086 family metal-binding protein [Dactylosporangium darangshiense]|uniref:Maleylpyruvate isomerase family mycothiol-dependent enzyme n=1 Tax=Dactylosporangium darangshiense TaxID=579108 RepID=A0ABP8DFJ7_9ACTN
MSSAADDHRTTAARFGELVAGTTDWSAPAPCEGWTALDVVRHLIEWLPGFLESGAGIELPAGPPVDEDPVGAWQAHAAAVQAVLDDPASAAVPFSNRHTGDMPVPAAIAIFYTSDVFLHTWDLARATGQDEHLDPQRCAAMLEGMRSAEPAMRASGEFGPAVEVPADADPQTRLLAFIGRRP